MSEAMNLQASDFQTLNNLYQMQSLLTNMQTNIYLIDQGAVGQIIQVTNANLFQLAAQYYGDATLWTTIAQANGLHDPVIQVSLEITIEFSIFLVITGYPETSQTITITLSNIIDTVVVTTIYTYEVGPNDTLTTIATSIASLIPGATSTDNVIALPSYLDIDIDITRFVNLVIPINAVDQGGILEVV